MLKPAARNGQLCFGPNRGPSVTFVSPKNWLQEWRDVDPQEAIVEAARRYLRAYGPATKSDFARWWGAWPGVGNAAWSGIAGELAQVSVEGARMDLLATDVKAITQAKIDQPVQLLPAFDPYILGHATRDHLFERAYASRVSRTAGWISAVVLVEGNVAGTWTHRVAGKTFRVAVQPFRRLTPRVVSGIRERAGELSGAVGAAKAEVSVA